MSVKTIPLNNKIKPVLPVVDFSNPLAKGLVAYWPFFEGNGTKLWDISGYNNHGTLTSMEPATDWIKTPWGYGLEFDGTEYVAITHTSSLQIVGDLTLRIRFKLTGTGTQTLIENAGGANEYFLWVEYGTDLVFYQGGGALAVTAVLTTGVWYDAIITRRGTQLNCYINGVWKASSTCAAPTAGTSLIRIGLRDAGNYGLYGQINELSFWKRGLVAQEVTQLYVNLNAIYLQKRRLIVPAAVAPPVTARVRKTRMMKYW